MTFQHPGLADNQTILDQLPSQKLLQVMCFHDGPTSQSRPGISVHEEKHKYSSDIRNNEHCQQILKKTDLRKQQQSNLISSNKYVGKTLPTQPDVEAGIGHRQFVGLVGIHPRPVHGIKALARLMSMSGRCCCVSNLYVFCAQCFRS